MAFRFLATPANQYLSRAVSPITSYPYSIAAWFKVPDVTNDYDIVSVGDGTFNEQIKLRSAGGAAGDPLRFRTETGAVNQDASSTTSIFANRWNHALGVGASSTSRSVFLNGAGKNTSTASSTFPVGCNIITIGVDAEINTFFSGVIAEVTMWNIALPDAAARFLASGQPSEKCYPKHIVGCWTLKDGSLKDSGPKGYHLRINSGARAATEMDPVTRIRPSRRTYFRVAAAGGATAVPVFYHHRQTQGMAS